MELLTLLTRIGFRPCNATSGGTHRRFVFGVLLAGLFLPPVHAQWFVRGDFNGWSTDHPLTQVDDNVYAGTITGLFDSTDYEYRIATADWSLSVPGTNGKVRTDINGELHFNFWDITSWNDGWVPRNQRRVGYADHGFFDWEVIGSFNDWSIPLSLTDQGNGLHAGTFQFDTGSYQFKFREQGSWNTNIGRDFGNNAGNNIFNVYSNGEEWTFELDLPNGRWRSYTNAPQPVSTVNGSRVGKQYGAPLAIQTVNTSFGDHNTNLGHKGSELNAAYARIADGKLYLMLTGNLEDNFNKLVLFFDSKPGGQNILDTDTDFGGTNPVVDRSPFADNPGMFAKMAGGPGYAAPPTTFDTGFEADYALILRHGFTGTENRFDVDYAVVGGGNGATSQYLHVFDPTVTNTGVTGIGVNSQPIEVALDNSNNAGVAFGAAPASLAAAEAVTTGVEVAISLADLGSPAVGDVIKVTAFINSSNHDYVSNQFLGGLPAPQGNLGSDGLGNSVVHLTSFDLNSYAGNQFFSVVVLPGDFNRDGTVDAADYVVWRKGVDIEPTEEKYNLWRTNFGRSGGGGARAVVPEPNVVVLVCLCLAALCAATRAIRRSTLS
jgi:hypothetical protein